MYTNSDSDLQFRLSQFYFDFGGYTGLLGTQIGHGIKNDFVTIKLWFSPSLLLNFLFTVSEIDKGLSQCLLSRHPLILILSTAKIIVRFKFRQPPTQTNKETFLSAN